MTLFTDRTRLIFLPALFKNNKTKTILDTGSSLSIVSQEFVSKFSVKIKECDNNILLRVVHGKCVKPRGQVTFNLDLGNNTFTVTALVVQNFPCDILLGNNFMAHEDVDIIFSKRQVQIRGDTFPIEISYFVGESEKVLFVDQETTIPPRCEVPVEVKCKSTLPDTDIITQPLTTTFSRYGILVGHSLCKPMNEKVLIRVMNPSNKPVILNSKTSVGVAREVVDVFLFDNQDQKNKKESTNLIDSIRLPAHLNNQQRQSLKCLLQEQQDVISKSSLDVGKTSLVEHSIDTGDSAPIRSQPYRKSFRERQVMKELINEFKDKKLIQDSCSPWSSPVVLVRKRDGSWRFCCDWRKLNKLTKKDATPLPRVDDTLDRLAGSKFFSKIDLTSGFYQIKLDDDAREKSAFVTPDGHYEWNVMGMGLCNAPATFQKLMYTVLGNLLWKNAMAYLDDIIVFSKTFEEHLSDLKEVFEKLREANLKINPLKCSFAEQRIQYLGHIICPEGILPDPANTKSLIDYPVPNNVKKVQQFLGLAGYYRRFVQDFSKIARPLTDLTKKDTTFLWEEKHQKAFEHLRDRLLCPPILSHPDFSLPFMISTDASNEGLGAVLKQKINGHERVIAFTSKSLSKAEHNYSATHKECLAVIFAIQKFRPYLYGNKFTIVTDHCSLCSLMRVKNPNGRLARWSIQLQEFDFDIEYKSGKKHLDADALSRNPVTESDDSDPLFVLSVEGVESLKTAQENDPWMKELLPYIRDPTLRGNRTKRRQSRAFFIDENNLVNRRVKGPGGFHLTLFVPKGELRKEILYNMHDEVTAGHLGLKKTWDRIKLKYFWPKMFADVQNYVLSCESCNKIKVCHSGAQGLMQPLPPTLIPFERIGLDKLGPFPRSLDNNVHIFVATDYCTKLAIACPVPNGTAQEAAKFLLENVILKFGPPKTILTDRGREFCNETFDSLAKLYRSERKTTSAYHPQTNGLTERFNGTLSTMMSHYVNDQHTDWDRFLPHLLFAYNSSVHETTGYSPLYLLLGYQPSTIHDITLNPISNLDKKDYNFENIIYSSKAREIAAFRNQVAQDKRKNDFDDSRREITFSPGDLVWLRTPNRKVGKSEKLLPQFKGPFKIIAQTAPNDYEIEGPREKRDIVNVERLKLFKNRSVSMDESNDTTMQKTVRFSDEIEVIPRDKQTIQQRIDPINKKDNKKEQKSEQKEKKRGPGRPRKTDISKEWPEEKENKKEQKNEQKEKRRGPGRPRKTDISKEWPEERDPYEGIREIFKDKNKENSPRRSLRMRSPPDRLSLSFFFKKQTPISSLSASDKATWTQH